MAAAAAAAAQGFGGAGTVSAGGARARVLVVGSGWAAFRFLRDLRRSAYDVVLVSSRDHFVFTSLLPACATGSLAFAAIMEPVRTFDALQFFEADVTAIDASTKSVRCVDTTRSAGGGGGGGGGGEQREFRLEYEYLVLGCGGGGGGGGGGGALPGAMDVVGVAQHAVLLRSVDDALRVRHRVRECLARASQPYVAQQERFQLVSWVVVGNDATSIDLCAHLHDLMRYDAPRWFPDAPSRYAQITLLLLPPPPPLASFDPTLRDVAITRLADRDIDVRADVVVAEVKPDAVLLQDGTEIAAGLTVWATGGGSGGALLDALPWRKQERSGRLLVNAQLQVPDADGVFALGDCATQLDEPWPCSAYAAQQQGMYLANAFNANSPHGAPRTMAAYAPPPTPLLASPVYSTNIQWNSVSTGMLWRSSYFSKMLSIRNRILIALYSLKSWIFGRDIGAF